MAGAIHPIIPNTPGAAALLLGGVNTVWGKLGSGNPEFWQWAADLVYRDSTATDVAKVPLHKKEGRYLLVANTAMDYTVRGRMEPRGIGGDTIEILVGPVNAPRIDAKEQGIEIEPGEDPTGQIRQVITDRYSSWAAHLPLIQWCRLLTNGTPDPKVPAPVCYDQQPLISETHLIHPGKAAAGNTYSNLVKLAAAINEAGWTKVLTQLRRFPDFDGVTLPNAVSMKKPLVLCPSETVANRWIKFLGGPNVPRELMVQGNNAGISSVSVGRADVAVCDFLATVAGPNLNFDPEKRSYVFSRAGRRVTIFWEKVPPRTMTTGQSGHTAYLYQAEILYAYAYAMMHPAEYRGVCAVDEP